MISFSAPAPLELSVVPGCRFSSIYSVSRCSRVFPVSVSVYLSVINHMIILSSVHLSSNLPFLPSLSFTAILSIYPLSPVFNSCLLGPTSSKNPPPLPSRFSHVCRLSLFSPSSSVFLSLSPLCWSLWLILKGNQESEWDLKEREALRSTQQGRPSLDWNAAREKKQHTHTYSTRERRAFLSLLSLSSTSLLSHHSWAVWYLTFTLLQQGLGSKSSLRKLVSPLSYSVLPLFLFPLPLSFLLFLLLFLPLSSNRPSCFLPYRGGKMMLKYPDRHPHFYQ